jgi:hypothetical protein
MQILSDDSARAAMPAMCETKPATREGEDLPLHVEMRIFAVFIRISGVEGAPVRLSGIMD